MKDAVCEKSICVRPNSSSQHGNSKEMSWKYFGGLFDSEGCNVDEDCKLLNMQMSLDEKGHF